jgi:hypothetical protein
MLDKLERTWKWAFVIPLICYSVLCVGPRGCKRKSHAAYLMLMLKSQNSSAFEQLQVAQSLGLQKKKIEYMDQSVLAVFRYSGISMNLHKSGPESTLEVPSVTFPYLLTKSAYLSENVLLILQHCPIHCYICGSRLHRRHPTVKTECNFMSAWIGLHSIKNFNFVLLILPFSSVRFWRLFF